MPSTWEIVLEFVERTGHNSVGEIECLLNTVTVVNVDVDIEHPLVCFKQLENGQYAVVDVAKS